MAITQPQMANQTTSSPLRRAKSRTWAKVWRNRSLIIGSAMVTAIVLIAVLAPLLSAYSPISMDYAHLLNGPGAGHIFGTDELGRDEWTRIAYGARTSLEVTLGSVAFGLIVGIPVGLLSGFYRGIVDDWIVMRIVDALQAFPFLILALVLAAVLGPGIGNAMIAIGIGYLPVFVRIVRAQVIAEVKKEYVDAARMVGAGDWRIMLIHIFRNITSPLIVQASIAMAGGIVAESSLSYLGLGAQPPTPSWGSMLHTAQGYLGQAPWLAITPGVAIVIAVLGFNLLGEGLQQFWNPKAGS